MGPRLPRCAEAGMPVCVACTLGVLVFVLPLSGCGEPADLKQAVQIADISGGWFDAGVVDGKNKLVPSVSFRVKKNGDVDVNPLSLNVLFRATDGQESSIDQDEYVQRAEFQGDSTPPISVRPKAGYLGDENQTRAQMLQNPHFRDMRVTVFGKHSSSKWIELARYDIPRQVLTK